MCDPNDVILVRGLERSRVYASRYESESTATEGPLGAACARRNEQMQQLMANLRKAITKTRVFLNPLLCEKSHHVQDRFDPTFEPRHISYKFHSIGYGKHTDHHAEASWQRMLISQPPLGMVQAIVNGVGTWNSAGNASPGQPITMPLLIEALEKLETYSSFELLGKEQLEVEGEESKLLRAVRAQRQLRADNKAARAAAPIVADKAS